MKSNERILVKFFEHLRVRNNEHENFYFGLFTVFVVDDVIVDMVLDNDNDVFLLLVVMSLFLML